MFILRLELYEDEEIEEIHAHEKKNINYQVMLRVQEKRERMEKPISLDEIKAETTGRD